MPKYQSFETERLLLKPTDLEDAEFIFSLMNSPKWKMNIGDRKIHTVEDASTYIAERMLPQLVRLGHSNYTLIRKEDGVKMGSCGLYDREGLEGVDIGFALLPAYEKLGYAFESANLLVTLGFEIFKVDKISGITLPSNLASQTLLKKLNLTFEKMIRLPDDPDELMLFTLDAETYFENRVS